MSWRDSLLLPASWRGIPFHVEAHELTFGRRLVRHKYAERDTEGVQDLGREGRDMSVDAYVIGDDYMAVRDQLIQACEKKGEGLLVHPYFGEVLARLARGRQTERNEEGRMARFALEFVEAGALTFPTILPTLEVGPDAANTAAGELFADSFLADVTALANDISGFITDMLDTIATGVGYLAGAVGFVASVVALGAVVGTLLATPALLFGAILAAVGVLALVGILLALVDLFATTPAAKTGTTFQRQRAENRRALTRAWRRAALIRAAEVASTDTYTTYDEAIAIRDRIADAITTELAEDDLDDAAFTALVDLRTDVTEAITARAADLTRLVTWTPPTVTSTLELAQLRYADPTRADAIADRNDIVHPGFVPVAALRLEAE